MMSKIEFYTGPRNCGKSEYVEELLSGQDRKLYIGTLNNDPKYFETVQKHRKRRGTQWTTLEVTNDFNADISRFSSFLEKQEAMICMLDGILTWYVLINEKTGGRYCPEYFANQLCQMIKSTNHLWYIVDVYPSEVIEKEKYFLDATFIHDFIIEQLNVLSVIDFIYEKV